MWCDFGVCARPLVQAFAYAGVGVGAGGLVCSSPVCGGSNSTRLRCCWSHDSVVSERKETKKSRLTPSTAQRRPLSIWLITRRWISMLMLLVCFSRRRTLTFHPLDVCLSGLSLGRTTIYRFGSATPPLDVVLAADWFVHPSISSEFRCWAVVDVAGGGSIRAHTCSWWPWACELYFERRESMLAACVFWVYFCGSDRRGLFGAMPGVCV